MLRGFDYKLFMSHPSENLRVEDQRLEALDKETKACFERVAQQTQDATMYCQVE